MSINFSIPRTFSGDSKGELPERHLSLLIDTTAYRALALDAHTAGLRRFAGGAASWTAAPVAAAPVDAALVAAGPMAAAVDVAAAPVAAAPVDAALVAAEL